MECAIWRIKKAPQYLLPSCVLRPFGDLMLSVFFAALLRWAFHIAELI